jgi:cell wall-associated NlpC family hydrolase
MNPDPRLNAYRADLADARLRGIVERPRYAAGREARIVTGIAPLRQAPSRDAEVATHYHFGEPVLVFEAAAGGGFAWCQSLLDEYVGYVEARHVAYGTAPAPTHFVAMAGSYCYELPDLRSPVVDFLPRHSAVVVVATGLTTRGTEYARLDSGSHVPFACLAAQPPRSPDIVFAASLYLGCPYLWGGRSFLGTDCSGLVQSAFRDLGIVVPRDTDMQRETIGEAVAIHDLGGLRRGDLIYVPGHVLIYAGEGAVIHADGASMTVRRDEFADWIRAHDLGFTEFIVRRP